MRRGGGGGIEPKGERTHGHGQQCGIVGGCIRWVNDHGKITISQK